MKDGLIIQQAVQALDAGADLYIVTRSAAGPAYSMCETCGISQNQLWH